ncbi:MAG: phosphotransferase [Alphaproteobacteria bacterium]|nr:phosphotransferase [Alphaproteobacteria bacterium]
MSERAAVIDRFLGQAGWRDAQHEPLPGDASFRRYVRLRSAEKRTAILMDAPPPQENVRAYLAVARLLRRMGFSAPTIFNQDAEHGLLLLEDLGDETYTWLLARGDAEEPLYALAVDVLVALARRFAPKDAKFLPAYDDQRLLDEVALLADWYWPSIVGGPIDPALRAEYLALWQDLLPAARSNPATLVLRDYHVDNLMRVRNRSGLLECGLLDFQDAVIGPRSYDLVSLLEDARRDVTPDLVVRMKERYLAAFPELDRAAFEASYAILGAQRNAKIVGIFTRLCVRDGKPQYLVHIPRVWRLLQQDLAHPALAPMAAWLARHIPESERGIPPCRPAA